MTVMNPAKVTLSDQYTVADTLPKGFASKLTYAKLPVGKMTVYDGESQYMFEPKQDITPYESVMLMQMFVLASVPNYHSCDYLGYIKENNLERHFEKRV